MNTTPQTPVQWAQNEFAFAALGDQRRTKRLVNIAAHLAASPGGTLPQAFPDWAELKAAYRFFGQRGTTFERILRPHVERTRQSCRQPGEYLLIEDTTLLDYSRHPATAELGIIGDGGGRGFELHSALAVRVETWTLAQRPEGVVVGLFDQQCCRPQRAPVGETRGQRLCRPRKSQRWAAALKSAGRPPSGSRWIYMADRESVFYGPWRPGGWQPPLPNVGVVEVREVQLPVGVREPLHWILLTSLPCATQAEAQRVVGRYTARWWIEEYHKALKTGAGVEASQLERGDRLASLIAVLAVVAVRLLSSKMLARSRPASFEASVSFGPQMPAILEIKLGKPKGGWTNENVIMATARLGGFLARKHDGLPGWQTIWRGWQRLIWMCQGVETLNQLYNQCG